MGYKLGDVSKRDPRFFIPSSHLPNIELSESEKKDLWFAEVISYFSIPDSARESIEDYGLVDVSYSIKQEDIEAFHQLLGRSDIPLTESAIILQQLLKYMRYDRVIKLPDRVSYSSPAFEGLPFDISYALQRDKNNTIGWCPRKNKNGIFKDNEITDYLKRSLNLLSPDDRYQLAEKIWTQFLVQRYILYLDRNKGKLHSDSITFMRPKKERFKCNKCGIFTLFAVHQSCPTPLCDGKLIVSPYKESDDNIIFRWLTNQLSYKTLRSEEHTAQINKELAKRIEDRFKEKELLEGVNVLSSTTTFEMGINIGDLQKVLLRNAPPSGANYVQRIGRAGRGKDKNAVCITLCRRTKYDSDIWIDPSILMTGIIRTPTVFVNNKIIWLRHFNAIVFSKFLKDMIVDKKMLGDTAVKQQVEINAFLSLEAKKEISPNWLRGKREFFLDFAKWLTDKTADELFFNVAAKILLKETQSDFYHYRSESIKKYMDVVNAIESELQSLMEQREKLFKAGEFLSEIEDSIKKILSSDVISVLAKNGFLPRYAFPLDVVTLETGLTRWSGDSDVDLSRDRGIAVAEFAPDCEVIAHKKVFQSAGLYVQGKQYRPDKLYFAKCLACGQIRTGRKKDELKGRCVVCGQQINSVDTYIEPLAFSIRIMPGRPLSIKRYGKNTLLRQRQPITYFIDSADKLSFTDFGDYEAVIKDDGVLFRYNKGPNGQGFMLCPVCGASEPMQHYKPGNSHKKLRVFSGTDKCEERPWTDYISYAHKFISYCLIIRPKDAVLPIESLSYAFQKGLCDTLGIETTDVGVSWRWRGERRTHVATEIILYDLAPGGSGFVKEGFENFKTIIKNAYLRCNKCTCTTACYDCLKDYSNQSYHDSLNRKLVLPYLQT